MFVACGDFLENSLNSFMVATGFITQEFRVELRRPAEEQCEVLDHLRREMSFGPAGPFHFRATKEFDGKTGNFEEFSLKIKSYLSLMNHTS